MLTGYLGLSITGMGMTGRPKVLVTGASGLIGRRVIADLGDRFAFSGLSRRPVEGIPHAQADITDLHAVRSACRGMDMVLHLAAETIEYDDWDKVMDVTIGGTLNLYRAAQEAGVKRVVFASAGSTMIGYEWYPGSPYAALAANKIQRLPEGERMLLHTDPPRPADFYSVGKLFGENAGRLFSDKYGMSVIVIRVGAVLADDRFDGHVAFAPSFLRRLRIHRLDVEELSRWLDVAADAHAHRARRLRSDAAAATARDVDRLPQLTDLQRDDARPVGRLLQLELLVQFLEAHLLRLEHVRARCDRRECKPALGIGHRLDLLAVGFERELHVRHHSTGRIVDDALEWCLRDRAADHRNRHEQREKGAGQQARAQTTWCRTLQMRIEHGGDSPVERRRSGHRHGKGGYGGRHAQRARNGNEGFRIGVRCDAKREHGVVARALAFDRQPM